MHPRAPPQAAADPTGVNEARSWICLRAGKGGPPQTGGLPLPGPRHLPAAGDIRPHGQRVLSGSRSAVNRLTVCWDTSPPDSTPTSLNPREPSTSNRLRRKMPLAPGTLRLARPRSLPSPPGEGGLDTCGFYPLVARLSHGRGPPDTSRGRHAQCGAGTGCCPRREAVLEGDVHGREPAHAPPLCRGPLRGRAAFPQHQGASGDSAATSVLGSNN